MLNLFQKDPVSAKVRKGKFQFYLKNGLIIFYNFFFKSHKVYIGFSFSRKDQFFFIRVYTVK